MTMSQRKRKSTLRDRRKQVWDYTQAILVRRTEKIKGDVHRVLWSGKLLAEAELQGDVNRIVLPLNTFNISLALLSGDREHQHEGDDEGEPVRKDPQVGRK